MYWFKTPAFFASLFNTLTWKVPQVEKTLYLTFDDGPTPEITPWVMDQLDAYSAKGTFFCVGKNAAQHPEIVEKLLAKGHALGNHTYTHKNAFKVSLESYLEDVQQTQQLFSEQFNLDLRLFRPPYGRITPWLKNILAPHFNIVMWDVLSGDFDPTLSEEKCARTVVEKAGSGSIIVFHDSVKCREKLYYTLPKVLGHFHKKGYRFAAIS